jgi:hypothetical protein
MNPIVILIIQSVADLRRTPIQNLVLMTPRNSGHTLAFDDARIDLNCFYVGDLLMDNGHWKQIQGFNLGRCTISTTRRHAASLKIAEAFFCHHYPNLLNLPLILPLNNQTAN